MKSTSVIKIATMDDFHYKKEAIKCWPQNWNFLLLAKMNRDTKEDAGNSMKNELYALWCTKRHLFGKIDIEQQKIKLITLVIVKLHLPEGISQSGIRYTVVSQSVEI